MPTLINVCGEGRSGSTMLDLMLGNGADAYSCGEVYAWFRPWRTHHFKIVCSCGKSPCPEWEKIKDVPESGFHSAASKKLGTEFIIDSSKELCWLVDSQDWARKTEMSVFNFALWKDPIAMAHSQWKRNRPIDEWTQSYVTYYQRIIALGIPFYAVEFGRLSREPQQLLKRMCDITGLGWFDGKEAFWKGEHHHLFGSMGTRKQSVAGDGQIRAEETFSPEFEQAIPEIQAQLDAIPGLAKVVTQLKERDIETVDATSLPSFRRPDLMPFWYYERALKRIVRRRFPQQWHLEQ